MAKQTVREKPMVKQTAIRTAMQTGKPMGLPKARRMGKEKPKGKCFDLLKERSMDLPMGYSKVMLTVTGK